MARELIQLEDFNLKEFSIVSLDEPSGSRTLDSSLMLGYQVGRIKKSDRKFRLVFRVQVEQTNAKGKKSGYKIDSRIVGDFSFPAGFPQNKMEATLLVNGGLMLYGILRGHVALMTSGFKNGKLTLPSFDIQELVEQAAEAKLKKSKVRKKKVPTKAKPKSRPKKKATKATGTKSKTPRKAKPKSKSKRKSLSSPTRSHSK